MKKIILQWMSSVIVTLVLIFNANLFSATKKILVSQRDLPGFTREMLSLDFWLAKVPNPEALIWTDKEIDAYNTDNLRKGRYLNPYNMGVRISAQSVRKFADEDLKFLRRYIKYDTQGVRQRDPKFSNYLKRLINYNSFWEQSSVAIQYGIIVDKEAELRYAPTELKLYRTQEDKEFEILKKTHIDIFSQVAIMWKSQDLEWYFVETPLSRGWVKREHVVTGPINEVKNFFSDEKSGVVINPLAQVYRDDGKRKRKYNPLILPMGTTVYYRDYDSAKEFTKILVPERSSNSDNGKLTKVSYYIKTEDIYPGFLTFNYRNLIKQAFKYLHTPYSWGGSYNSTDCSLFLYRVYRSFGIIMPRSSSKQIISLKYEKIFPKNYSEFSDKILPLRTIAHIDGPTHILLYLGKYDNKDYYIHSTWSYYDSQENEYLIQAVVISDLTLGINSKLGSLEKRISSLGFF